MNRILAVSLIFVLMLQSLAFAQTFTVSVSQGSITFPGLVDPGTWVGDEPPGWLTVNCKTDYGNAWHLSIEYNQDLSNGSYTIPYPNFKCWGYTAGSGIFHISGGESISLSTAPFVLYDSTVGEGSNLPSGTDVFLQFGVWIPEDTVAGTYTNQIILTMYE